MVSKLFDFELTEDEMERLRTLDEDRSMWAEYDDPMIVQYAMAEHIDHIVVLYNYASVHREMCPEPLRYWGLHLPAYQLNNDCSATWRYQDIKDAICG